MKSQANQSHLPKKKGNDVKKDLDAAPTTGVSSSTDLDAPPSISFTQLVRLLID